MGLTNSRENIGRNRVASREVEETQSGSASYTALTRRLRAGGSTTYTEEMGSYVSQKQRKKSIKKKQHSGPSLEIDRFRSFSSYNYSNNSEAPPIPTSRYRSGEAEPEKQKKSKNGKSEKANFLGKPSKPIIPADVNSTFPEQAVREQFPVKRHLDEIRKIVENFDEIRNLFPKSVTAHLSAVNFEESRIHRRKKRHPQLRDEPVLRNEGRQSGNDPNLNHSSELA